MRKLIPAIIMLFISALLFSTATFAWFSMNNVVNITLMPTTAFTNGIFDTTIFHNTLSALVTNLVYVANTNTNDVNLSTGLAKTGKTLYYAAVATPAVDGANVGHYYKVLVLHMSKILVL